MNDSKPTHCNGWAFLFALAREARPFQKRNPHERVVITGVGAARAEAVTRRVIESDRPAAVICCGFAGALQPKWSVGDVIIAREVVDEAWRTWTWGKLQGSARLLTMSQVVADPREKARLGDLYLADAVDMESAVVARVCCEASVPVGCVRVISDTVDQQLSSKLVRLLADGDVSVGKAIAALVRSPSLLPEFLRLARQTAIASRKLAEALEAVRRG